MLQNGASSLIVVVQIIKYKNLAFVLVSTSHFVPHRYIATSPDENVIKFHKVFRYHAVFISTMIIHTSRNNVALTFIT